MSQPPLYKPLANYECKKEGSKRVWPQKTYTSLERERKKENAAQVQAHL